MVANAISCINSGRTYDVNFNGNTPAIDDVWLIYNTKGLPQDCVKIVTLVDQPISDFTLNTLKTDCQTCYESQLVNDYHFVYQFTTCLGFRQQILFDPTTFGFVPTGFTYFVQYETIGGNSFEGCFGARGATTLTNDRYIEFLTTGNIGFVTETPIEEVDCQTCLTANTNYYEVVDCATGNNIVLNFPPGYSPCGILFTYTDGVDQYCGNGKEICNQLEPPQTPIGDFVADLGKYEESNSCDTCLSGVAETRIITNCLTDEIDVVWNSLLNQVGDASNLSSSDGCYEIGPITSATPTLFGFLNFDPQPDCQDCIQCNGVTYTVEICGGEGPTVLLSSYDYHPIGTVIYHPLLDVCCTITDIQPGLNGTDTVYSVRTYSDCPTCQSALRERWVFDWCYRTSSGYYDGVVVTEPGVFSFGDVVNIKIGNSEFSCVSLDTTISGTYSGYYGYDSQTTVPYTSCSACTDDQTYVGVTLLSCSDQTYGYYRVTISDFEEMTGVNGLLTECVSDSNGYCYTMINTCPIAPETNYPIFTPSSKYFNCTICQQNEYINVARSANTETLVCVTCCPCDGTSGSTFSVVPPHPVWTDGYGTPVTQLNMITLGGINGLNG